MAMRRPRRSRMALSLSCQKILPMKSIAPPSAMDVPSGASRMMARAVTLLPQPDSADEPDGLAGAISKEIPYGVATAPCAWRCAR